ncbi:peptidoglycan DD-metalloendopeptidase family protein [Streptomyces californicus]|uniref:peptidoglycan DD-metalloendopeptidase family protein n=1 Tax=Streptomyces californicus TaxID=67351 RepID=UPI00296F6D65|nr:peptidoglycan DD-metalloendopeptidase family protein [Streptomyces californicus]MDW4918478.1 peptidoglycan DD-metalloendopeptidase family protein [Streptomyces californicus]
MSDLDIVGGAAVDVVPVIPRFNEKLRALVLPIADRVGSDAGERMGREMSRSLAQHLTINVPSAVNHAGQAAQAASRRQGDQNAGAFASSMRRHLTAAFRSMPHLDVRITATGADAELARLRAKLEQLSNKRVGIDISAEAARAEIERIERELERLGASHPNVQVRADTAAARAALVAMREEIDAVDRRDIRVPVDVDTSRATSALMALGIQMGATAAIPLGPIIAAGLGAVVTAAAAAGAGVGALALVAVPAIKEVTSTLQLKRAAEDEASRATERSATSNAGAASKALQLAGAQAQLATAHRNAAQSIAAAERQVEAARRAVGEAAQRAAEQQQSAADGVRRAEQSLTDAKRSARDAEAALTQAREDAAAQLARLSDRLIDGHLDQREATLRVQQAQETLNETLKDAEAGKATRLQVEAAQLAYDRAKQNAAETKQSFEELTKSAAKQRRAGVEGSDAVKDATERVAQAQRGVSDQTDALRQAHAAAAKAAVDGSRAVAAAQERVSQATANVANAQASAADSIASAQRSIQSAQATTTTTTAAATTQQDAYRKALADMTPAARDLFNAISGPAGLTEAFKAWSRELQPEILPLFTRGVNGAKNSLPGLTPLVKSAAEGVGELFDSASAELKTPFWQQFKDGIATGAEPAIVGLGKAVGNVFKGIAGIIDAFLPHLDGVASGADNVTAKFAKWGTSLKGSPEFENFLKYTKDTAPGVGDFLRDVLKAAFDVSKAVAPLSTTVMAVIGPVFEAVSWLATNQPELVVGLWAIFAAQRAIAIGMTAFAAAMMVYQSAVLLSTIATSGFGFVLAATGIGPIIKAIVVVVGLLAAALVYAYKNFDGFRMVVDTVAGAIKTAALWIWDNGLKPAFDGIWTGLKAIGSAAMWLWENALSPFFSFLFKWGKILFTALVVVFLTPVLIAFKLLGAVAMWLWEKAIGPAFRLIGAGAKWLWDKAIRPVFGWIGDKALWLYEKAIKPAFKWIGEYFDLVGRGAKLLWDKAIRPIFNWIGDKATWLYEKGIKPHFDHIKTAMRMVAVSFGKARDDIRTAWNAISSIAKKPVKFVIDKVYNEGIVPLWNRVAGITGADPLKPFKGFHTGGIMSGYSPGRDDRVIAVGGGEAIMRPEWTRAVGADTINSWNAAARSGGVSGVQRAISDGLPAFKDGGIVGWLKDKAGDVGDFLSGAADFVNPAKLFAKAKDYLSGKMEPILENPWAKSVAKLPLKMLSSLKDVALGVFGFGGGGSGPWAKPVNAGYGTPFGKAGSMWSSGRHTGLDFPAAIGTAVKAVADGKVAMAKSGGPYGNHIMLNHGGGLTSLYAHLNSILTSVGDSVTRGQKIGTVGSTGNSSGPHLHLEARVNGRAVDPMTYLSGGGGAGGKGVERWRPVVKAALAATGNPASYANLTLRRMQQESGGNPNAVNNWDINAKNGTPSVGLMQVIKPTFEAFAGMFRTQGPFKHGVSVDPMANIFSSMRYAKATYGSLPKAYNRPGGYAAGGYPRLGEMAWVGEQGPELLEFLTPTRVHSNADSMAIARATQSIPGQGAAAPVINADVHVYVGDREITDIVRVEVDARQDAVATALGTGRYL